MTKEERARVNNETRIYTVFLSSGHPIGFDAYRKQHPDIKVMDNHEILKKIKDECKGIEFLGKAEAVKPQDVIQDIKGKQDVLDGLLVFGAPPDELIQEGLPIVAVSRPLEGCTTVPFHAYKETKVVTSCLPAHCDKDPEVYSLRIKDIGRKIKIGRASCRERV